MLDEDQNFLPEYKAIKVKELVKCIFNESQEEYEDFHDIQEKESEAQLLKENPNLDLDSIEQNVFDRKQKEVLITLLQYDIKLSYEEMTEIKQYS